MWELKQEDQGLKNLSSLFVENIEFQENVIVVQIIIMDHIKAESIILSHLFCVLKGHFSGAL